MSTCFMDWYLVYLFWRLGNSLCYTTDRKNIFLCLLLRLPFSWTSILSTFFTVRMFHSVNSYAGVCCFFMSIVSGLSAYFTDWYPIYLFSRSEYFVAENWCFMSTFTPVYFIYGLVLCRPFFTVFLSVTAYAGTCIWCFFRSTFIISIYLFHGLVPCVPFWRSG